MESYPPSISSENREAPAAMEAASVTRHDKEKADELLSILQEEAKKYRAQRAAAYGVYAAFGALMLLLLGVSMMRGISRGDWDFGDWGSYFWFFALFGSMAAMSQKHKEAASQLAQLQDIRAVGLLAEALESDDTSLKRIVTKSLPGLLRRLQASDAHLLDTEQRKILNKVLKKAASDASPELALAILKSYEQVGDESSLADVERLAHLPPQRSPNAQKVAEAARECLPYLEKRIEQAWASQTLLRASSAADALSSAPEMLLRPALETGETPPQELLRASKQHQEAEDSLHRQEPPAQPEKPVKPVYLTEGR